jgi:hypothetical protein
MNAESLGRALGAANDLLELLRLAEGAAARLTQEVHGASHGRAMLLARELVRLRRSAERLALQVESDADPIAAVRLPVENET